LFDGKIGTVPRKCQGKDFQICDHPWSAAFAIPPRHHPGERVCGAHAAGL